MLDHSYSHQRMVFKSPCFVRDELEQTDSLIQVAGQSGTIHFRPPYGKRLVILPWILSRNDRTTVLWNLEPDSYPDIAQIRSGSSLTLWSVCAPDRLSCCTWRPVAVSRGGRRCQNSSLRFMALAIGSSPCLSCCSVARTWTDHHTDGA
ncbi:MAG: polysaccharide deacetylase family protein [Gemmatimonadaceae bacterium]